MQNPCFDGTYSHWTYKFLTDTTPGNQGVMGISNIVIPVCETISKRNITVYEQIDGCGPEMSVEFSLSPTDPNHGAAPAGFNWVKVEVDDRYDKGVCVKYRLQILGNYPECSQEIGVKAGPDEFFFGTCDGCYFVPCCPEQAQITVTKTCEMMGTEATFTVNVCNTGDTTLNNIDVADMITFPANLSVTEALVEPNTFNLNVSPGLITVSGVIDSLEPGGCEDVVVYVTFDPDQPGVYTITNVASATADDGTTGMDDCFLELTVVQVSAEKCCIVNGNGIQFQLLLINEENSPATTASIQDELCIPDGLTVEFSSFAGCAATFVGDNEPVPLNEPVTGPTCINIVCEDIEVPEDGIASRTIELSVTQSTTFGVVEITNALNEVTVGEEDQVALPTEDLPAEANVSYTVNLVCDTPCNGFTPSVLLTRNQGRQSNQPRQSTGKRNSFFGNRRGNNGNCGCGN